MTEASPRFIARMGGFFYFLMVLIGSLASIARRGIIVGGNPAATATNIMAHESLYRLAFACDLLMLVSYIAVVAYFHQMLRPVSRSVALVAALLGVAGCTIQAVAAVFELAPLAVLGGAKYLSVFKPDELQAQAYLYLRLYNQAYSIALVFFGFFMIVTGYLVYKSAFLPRLLGPLFALGGLAWLTYLVPSFGAKILTTWILPFDIGEALLPLWLLAKGVNAERWKEQERATGVALSAT